MARTSIPACVRGIVLLAVILAGAPRAGAAPIVLDATGVATLNNLQLLALAAQNYEAVFRRFPSDIVDGGGTPMLSWRVGLLPFVGEAALFSQFDTSKAWDAPVNLALLSRMPDAFRSPWSPIGSTDTDYAGGVHAGTMFEGGPGPRFSDVTDGTSNTILFGEATGSSIPWTKPGDIAVGNCPTLGGSGFSSFIPGAVPFAFVDGSVGLLPDSIDCATLLALLVRNDNVVVDKGTLLVPYSVPEPAAVMLLSVAVAGVWRSVRRTQGV